MTGLVSRKTKLQTVNMTLESRELWIPISLARKKSYFDPPLRNLGLRPIKPPTTFFLPAFKFLSDRARPCSSSILSFSLFFFLPPANLLIDRNTARRYLRRDSTTWRNIVVYKVARVAVQLASSPIISIGLGPARPESRNF